MPPIFHVETTSTGALIVPFPCHWPTRVRRYFTNEKASSGHLQSPLTVSTCIRMWRCLSFLIHHGFFSPHITQNGRSLAHLHDRTSDGRSKGDNGSWLAESATVFQYEKAFPPTGPTYPPGSYIAVYGCMARTDPVTDKLLTEEKLGRKLTQQEINDITGKECAPCSEARRNMPPGQDCAAVLTQLGIGYDGKLGD